MASLNHTYVMNTNIVTVHILILHSDLPCVQLESLSRNFVLEDAVSPKPFRSTFLALHSLFKFSYDTRLSEM